MKLFNCRYDILKQVMLASLFLGIALTNSPLFAQTNRIITPDDNAIFTDVESFTVEADVEDADGISVVRLWIDDGATAEVVGLLNDPPFSWEISGLSAGTYEFYTRSKDGLGNTSDSNPITVRITEDDGSGGGTFPELGSTIVISAVNGKYISADNSDNELIANSNSISDMELFEVVDAGDNYVAFKCLGNGKFVAATEAGDGTLKANRNTIGNWEQFRFTEKENQLGFVAKVNDKWVVAEKDGAEPLIANRNRQGSWESFGYSEVEAGDEGEDPPSDPGDPSPDPSTCADFPIDQTKLEAGPMVGHTSDNSAIIWVHPKNTNQVEVYYGVRNSGECFSTAMRKAENDDDSFRATLSGLSANTRYDYDVVVDGNRILGSGTFKTAPRNASPAKFTFAVTSCAKSADDDQQTGWFHMKNKNPDFMMYVGDTIYTNASDLKGYKRSNRIQKQISTFADIIKDVPIYTTWDDHDFGGNDSNKESSRDGVPGSTLRKISLNAFKDAWANPYAGGPSQGVYYDFSWGEVDFFVLDNRYHRTGHYGKSNSEQLGSAQLDWLKSKLLASDAVFKFIVQGGNYNGGTRGGEGFQAYPTEFNGLRNFIRSNRIDGVVWMSGDTHKNELRKFTDGNRSLNYPAYAIVSSGMGRSNKRGRWAKIDIDTTISDPTLQITFYEQNVPTLPRVDASLDWLISEIEYTIRKSEISH